MNIDRLRQETFVAQVHHYLTLGSTNDCAKRLAEGDPGELPLLIVSDEQTSGRGRGANRWWTGRGSLAFSLLLDTSPLGANRASLPLVAVAAGVAVVEAIAPLVPNHVVGIHWPNDVYIDDRKLAGILVEVPLDRRCVVGIGLNVNNSLCEAPCELQQSVTTLRELTGVMHAPTEILLGILTGLEGLLGQLAREPETVAAKANSLCLQHGRMLSVQQGNRSITGRCAGIDADGGLVLETADGRQKVFSGTLR